jgi:transcription initiation factor TFIIA small subunit
MALADTLDELIGARRIEPQLAMRILGTFDECVAKVLGEKVKARMSFKVQSCRKDLKK